jgi:GNAT superfamily N-acetyltransferase
MRELYRRELDCQIVHDSFLSRGLSDPYLIRLDGQIAGYGAVSNKYDKGRLNEFHLLPDFRGKMAALFGALLTASKASHIEAQTNAPLLYAMLREFGANTVVEKILFHDGLTTQLTCPDGIFRRRCDTDGPGMFGRAEETLPQWVIEANREIVAAGGYLTHYNPPYADVFMEVAEGSRRQGYGSYLVQELKRICHEADKRPAARCDPSNVPSRSTLEKAGLLVCGEMLVAEVRRR